MVVRKLGQGDEAQVGSFVVVGPLRGRTGVCSLRCALRSCRGASISSLWLLNGAKRESIG